MSEFETFIFSKSEHPEFYDTLMENGWLDITPLMEVRLNGTTEETNLLGHRD